MLDKNTADIETYLKNVKIFVVLQGFLSALPDDHTLDIATCGPYEQFFEDKLGKLFDIVNCKCQILNCEEFPHCEGCMVRAHNFCECDDDQKIPEVELIYQRSRQDGSMGKYQMGGKNNKEIENMIEEELGKK